jgi:hypothetical protein
MDTFLQILSEYGLTGFILVLVVTVAFKVLMNEYYGSLGKFAKSLSGPAAESGAAELRYHPFFSSAHYKIIAELPTLELSPTKPVKQMMFRDILTIYIKTMIDTCSEIVESDMSGWSGEKWSNEVSKHMNCLVTDFHTNALAAGIPDAALSKFSKWHYPTLEMLYEYIVMLGNSNIYATNLARTNTFLLMMNLLLVTTLGDAERSLKELNGEVSGKMYKNEILEH